MSTHATRDDEPRPTAAEIVGRYRQVRRQSLRLVEPLAPEDMVVQSMPDASPAKWHLAHTTWFFEAVILRGADPAPAWYRDDYAYLFNSYYNSLGEQYPRSRRGLISRPTVAEVLAYRNDVDERMEALLLRAPETELTRLAPLVTVGLNHEQQHQELVLTDVKHLLAANPMFPAYRPAPEGPAGEPPPLGWRGFDEGVREIGFAADGFAYDNEGPPHPVLVPGFELATRPVTAGEYLEFMADGGYARPELWMSEGWAAVVAEGWQAPLYWLRRGDAWMQFTLAGLRPVAEQEPVCHVSQFEADAYARWSGARLPTEQEWEVAAGGVAVTGNFVESERFHPAPAPSSDGLVQVFGDVWEWTASQYLPYPGYRPEAGPLGEYNGKFMANQHVLRGGSCATPADHVRATYRNFWPAHTRFQFAGFRLARDRG